MLTDHDAHMWYESLKDLFDGTRNDVDAERRRRFSNAYMFKMGGKCHKAHMDKGWGHLPQPAASAAGKVLLDCVWKIVGRLTAVIRAKAQIGAEQDEAGAGVMHDQGRARSALDAIGSTAAPVMGPYSR